MKKAFSLIALAALLFVATTLQANDPEDILRNLPAPEVHYPVEEIRIKPVPAVPAADPVPLPPPARPYEIRKLVDKAKETSGNPIVKTTRKIVETLSRPKAKVATHTHAIASATRSIATGTLGLAAAKPQQTIQPTWVVKAAKTLAENPVFTMLDARIASETAFAKDVFDIYVQGYESEEKPAEEEQPVAKFDSIMVTAAGLQKKAQWQELKNLFAENPEAGETVEGLRFQIEAEVNSAKPNYMNAQRFARQLLESEGDDPLGHYAMAMFYYNSKKPNLTQAKKSLDIALKAKNPPAGASSLYWTMTLKGLAIPLLLVFAGLAGGVAHFIKKRKAAAVATLLENEATPAKDVDPAAPTAASESPPPPASGLKAKLQAISEKIRELLKKMPFGKGKSKPLPAPEENAANSEKTPGSAIEAAKQSENPAEESDEEQSESSEEEEEEEEIYELEGEDSELLEESDSDSDSDEDAADEQETSEAAEISEPDGIEEIIEEVVDEEAGEDNASDEVEIVEVEEEEVDEETDTVEEIIEEIVEEEEETEEVEYEVEEEIIEEDEPEAKG